MDDIACSAFSIEWHVLDIRTMHISFWIISKKDNGTDGRAVVSQIEKSERITYGCTCLVAVLYKQ